MERRVLTGPGVPAQIGPYSQATVGQTFAEQARQAFANLDAVLRAAGSRPDLVVATQVLVVGPGLLRGAQRPVRGVLPHRPADADDVAGAALPRDLLISMGCTALVG